MVSRCATENGERWISYYSNDGLPNVVVRITINDNTWDTCSSIVDIKLCIYISAIKAYGRGGECGRQKTIYSSFIIPFPSLLFGLVYNYIKPQQYTNDGSELSG
jgi:hypothetical protein